MAITLTERAAEEVKRAIQQFQESGQAPKDKDLFLRLAVKGGGCSGFENKLDLDHKYNEEKDDLSEQHGVKLVVDRKSMLYVDGSQIEYIEELNRRGFHITNPNVKTTCGCGSSYSV